MQNAHIYDSSGKHYKSVTGTIDTILANVNSGDTYEIVDKIKELDYSDRSLYVKSKEELVVEILVTTTSGKVFDGDEKSQDRMVRAIQIASIASMTETQWKLADNSIIMVTLDELKEALSLAGQEMSRIWLEQ